jgi:hypothetical protein
MLFDPKMHTFEYVRHKSSFLWVLLTLQTDQFCLLTNVNRFSAILSSSAKFAAPELYKGLLQLTMDYSLRAILVRGRCVETIQGWMIVRLRQII